MAMVVAAEAAAAVMTASGTGLFGMTWTAKYAPTCIGDVVGNGSVGAKLRAWLQNWRVASGAEEAPSYDVDGDDGDDVNEPPQPQSCSVDAAGGISAVEAVAATSAPPSSSDSCGDPTPAPHPVSSSLPSSGGGGPGGDDDDDDDGDVVILASTSGRRGPCEVIGSTDDRDDGEENDGEEGDDDEDTQLSDGGVGFDTDISALKAQYAAPAASSSGGASASSVGSGIRSAG